MSLQSVLEPPNCMDHWVCTSMCVIYHRRHGCYEHCVSYRGLSCLPFVYLYRLSFVCDYHRLCYIVALCWLSAVLASAEEIGTGISVSVVSVTSPLPPYIEGLLTIVPLPLLADTFHIRARRISAFDSHEASYSNHVKM